MKQLNLMFDDYDTPNSCGVYSKCERIIFNNGKDFRGSPLAEIAIANTPRGFIFAVSLCFASCGISSLPSEVGNINKYAPTRNDALQKAKLEILNHVVDGNYSKEKHAPIVAKWIREVAA